MKAILLRKTRSSPEIQSEDPHDSRVDPSQFDSSSIGYQLRDTYNAWVRTAQGQLGHFGITVTMWLLLLRLWQEDGLTQKELIDHAALMQSSTSTVLNKLIHRGLVGLRITGSERRKFRYFLTRKGRSMVQRLTPAAMGVRSIALHGLSPQEVSVLGDLLRRIRVNLTPPTGDSKPPAPSKARGKKRVG